MDNDGQSLRPPYGIKSDNPSRLAVLDTLYMLQAFGTMMQQEISGSLWWQVCSEVLELAYSGLFLVSCKADQCAPFLV